MGEYRRFYVSANAVFENEIVIEGEEYKHIGKVLRMKPGDKAVVCDGSGYEYFCEITSFDKIAARLIILERNEASNELEKHLVLFQACVKGDKAEFIIQKATELGVKELYFFDSRFCVAKLAGKNERYNKIAVEAAKQCGRALPMTVHECISFKQMKEFLPTFDKAVFCYEKEKENTLKEFLKKEEYGTLAVIIGSEGGFSDEEAEEISEKAVSVKLCNRILRAETASVFALSVIVSDLEG